MANVKNLLAAEEARGVGRAVRTVLRYPLITHAARPEEYEAVHRHRAEAAKWFSYFCGWKLEADHRSASIRLYKLIDPDTRHPLKRPRGAKAPFDRRRYALLCLAAAELLGSPVILLTELSEAIAHACGDDPGLLEYRLNHGSHRTELVDAVLFLALHGAVEIVDGSAQTWQSDEHQAVLLRANPAVLMSLLASPQPPSRVEGHDIALLAADPKHHIEDAGSESGRRRYTIVLRQRVMRRLADTAVVHFDELDDDERAYLGSLTGGRQVEQAAKQAGMVCEWRTDGIMWIDPDRIATDYDFPGPGGTAKQAALLVLHHLQEVRTATLIETEERLRHHLGGSPKWAKEYQAPGGAARLVDEALAILADFGLARRDGARVEIRPAADRYRITAPKTSGSEGQ